jgi:tetratricopeptide (TPR) repeat protein
MVWTWEMEGELKPYHDDFLKDLKRQLRLHGTLKEHAIGLGLHERFFYGVFAGKTPLPLDLYFKLVTTFDLSLPSWLKTLEQRISDKPVEILLSLREQRELASNAFLGRINARICRILACEVDVRIKGPSIRESLHDLEDLRFSDRLEALRATEKLAHVVLGRLEETKGPKAGNELGDLAAILALWAAIQRLRGFRDLGLNAFSIAFPVARRAGDHWALASCYQRAAYLLRDFDRPDLGAKFLAEAMSYFSGSRAQLDAWKCFMDRGYMLSCAGKFVESTADYERSLALLPGSEWRFRCAALQGLAVNALYQGKPDLARERLTAALQECKKVDLYLGQVKWASARIVGDLAQNECALRLYREATELLAKYGNTGDVAMISLDHSELLLRLQRYPAFVQLVSRVSAWLPKLRANILLCRTFEQLVDSARVGRVSLVDLEATRAAVEESWKNQGEQVLSV